MCNANGMHHTVQMAAFLITATAVHHKQRQVIYMCDTTQNNGHTVGIILFPLTVETNYSALLHYVTVKAPPVSKSTILSLYACIHLHFRKLGSNKKNIQTTQQDARKSHCTALNFSSCYCIVFCFPRRLSRFTLEQSACEAR